MTNSNIRLLPPRGYILASVALDLKLLRLQIGQLYTDRLFTGPFQPLWPPSSACSSSIPPQVIVSGPSDFQTGRAPKLKHQKPKPVPQYSTDAPHTIISRFSDNKIESFGSQSVQNNLPVSFREIPGPGPELFICRDDCSSCFSTSDGLIYPQIQLPLLPPDVFGPTLRPSLSSYREIYPAQNAQPSHGKQQ